MRLAKDRLMKDGHRKQLEEVHPQPFLPKSHRSVDDGRACEQLADRQRGYGTVGSYTPGSMHMRSLRM